MSYVIPLPDGMSESDLENFDLAQVIKKSPEKAMILADFALKHHIKEGRSAWIQAAQVIYVVKEKELWRHHPDGYTSFGAWCEQPEIDLPASVVSDMIAIVRYAPNIKEEASIDLYDVIEEVGHSKVRQLIPTIRDAHRAGTLKEQVAPMLDEIRASSFRDVLDMLHSSGNRASFNPTAKYKTNDDGTYSVHFDGLSYDQAEILSRKLRIKSWLNEKGKKIDNPFDDEAAIA